MACIIRFSVNKAKFSPCPVWHCGLFVNFFAVVLAGLIFACSHPLDSWLHFVSDVTIGLACLIPSFPGF